MVASQQRGEKSRKKWAKHLNTKSNPNALSYHDEILFSAVWLFIKSLHLHLSLIILFRLFLSS